MGRHRKHPTDRNNVKRPNNYADDESARRDIESRIGLRNAVCVDCDANNPADADSCRKCGGRVRRKRDFHETQ